MIIRLLLELNLIVLVTDVSTSLLIVHTVG